ncbi:MAG: D-alanyl-D-alanine carboxypeptidase family protein [Bacilli bacterium]|nr:D-alanyl-D-alanine carboxypeptidase family protein [Bacilli bacterium]
MRKRKINYKLILTITAIIILLILIVYKPKNEETNKLEELGYNSEEIELINNLNETNITYITDSQYNELYIDLIQNTDFIEDNFEKYIEYINQNNCSIDDAVYLVNNNIDKEYNENLVNLIKEKYYISSNLDRYYNYLINYPNLSTNAIISYINSNLDYDYYSTDYSADLSKDILVLANKYYVLSSDYEPSDLYNITSTYGGNGQYIRKEAYDNYIKLYNDITSAGLTLVVRSSYRSYSYQSTLYNNYVATDGTTLTDTYSARPGYSEHQTGLAIDVGNSYTSSLGDFEYTEEFVWMQENAYKYGFILRYPEDKTLITGYMYEPWHYRYVGVDVATYIHENNITFDEYYEYFIK